MTGRQLWSSPFARASIRPSIAAAAPASRRFSAASQRQQNANSSSAKTEEHGEASENQDEEELKGAMARRLSQMTEDAMLEGGRSAQRNMQQAGFSEDLKRQLEERVKAASFKSEYAAAHSILDMPVSTQTHPVSPPATYHHAATDPTSFTICRLAQAKVHEKQQLRRHGQEQKAYTTRPSACLTMPANQSAHHTRSPSPLT